MSPLDDLAVEYVALEGLFIYPLYTLAATYAYQGLGSHLRRLNSKPTI